MVKFTPVNCPNCGGAVEFPPDRKSMFCTYCGTNIVMEESPHGGGRVFVSGSVENILKLADELFEMENFDEAFGYYNRALEIDVSEWRAWLGRGRTQGWSSGPVYPKFDEMLKSFERATHFAPMNDMGAMEEKKYSYISEMMDRFTADDYIKGVSYNEFRFRTSFVLEMMELISREYPKDVDILKKALDFCDKVYRKNDRLYNIESGVGRFKNYILKWNSFFKNRLIALDPSMEPPKLAVGETSFFETNACIALYIFGMILFVVLIIVLLANSP